MAQAGFHDLPLATLIRARDHGVDLKYATAMKEAGIDASLEELIGARDHGVDARFVKRTREEQSSRLGLREIVRLKDRGH